VIVLIREPTRKGVLLKLNISLVIPPCLSKITRRPSYTREPHMGFAYIAAMLREKGYKMNIIDAEAMQYSAEETAARALENNPIFIGLTAHTALVKSASKVAKAINAINPKSTIVIGGYHTTALPERTLEEFPFFDIAVFGEGENTSVELARALTEGHPLSGVSGIVYHAKNTIVKNRSHPRIDNLDSLYFPAWDLFPLSRYHAHYRFDDKVTELPVNTGRGCPGQCKFCARVGGSVVRRRSTGSIIEEIQRDVEQFHAGAIVFFDETFTADPELVTQLCEQMIATGLNEKIYWLCETRVDWVTSELLNLMKRAGCRHISFGIESASQELLKDSRKGTKLDQIVEAVENAKKAGILVDNFYIFGLLGETQQSLKKTIDFAVRLNSDFANFFILAPFPGTTIYEMAKRGQGGLRLLTDDWDQYGIQMGKALELEELPRSRLERAQFRAYLRFYLRPSKILNMFRIVNLKVLPIYLQNLLSNIYRKHKLTGVTHEAT